MGDQDRWRRIAETVGLLGVMASVVYVGVEIRQNSEATRTATVQAVIDGWRELNIWLATDPSWAESRQAFAEAADPSELSYVQRSTLVAGWRTVFHQWMIGHYHHSEGNFPEGLWSGWVVEIESVRDDASLRWAWEREGRKFHLPFQEFMNGILGAP